MLNAVSPILVGRVAEMKSRKFVKASRQKTAETRLKLFVTGKRERLFPRKRPKK